jgi:hypothetical protein
MSRGPHNFKQTDVTKAVKAVVKAGVRGWRVEIVDGKIVICAAGERSDPVDERAPSEWD